VGKTIVAGRGFSEHRLTSSAGLIMVARFGKRLGIASIIDETVLVQLGDRARNKLGMIATVVALGIVSGCRPMSRLCELVADEISMKTLG
jgi:hypothetical protein